MVACYGADPTGTQDSSAALNNAFSDPSNQTRYLPAGRYRIASKLKIESPVQGGKRIARNNHFRHPGFTGTMANVVSTYPQKSVAGRGWTGTVLRLRWNGHGRRALRRARSHREYLRLSNLEHGYAQLRDLGRANLG